LFVLLRRRFPLEENNTDGIGGSLGPRPHKQGTGLDRTGF
jgi:hypothetical protein